MSALRAKCRQMSALTKGARKTQRGAQNSKNARHQTPKRKTTTGALTNADFAFLLHNQRNKSARKSAPNLGDFNGFFVSKTVYHCTNFFFNPGGEGGQKIN